MGVSGAELDGPEEDSLEVEHGGGGAGTWQERSKLSTKSSLSVNRGTPSSSSTWKSSYTGLQIA